MAQANTPETPQEHPPAELPTAVSAEGPDTAEAADTAAGPAENPAETQAEIPAEIHADYANAGVQAALAAFQQTPDYPHLATFLASLREGYLVVDVTGTAGKKRGPRVRTIRSTTGQLVLPIFTSLAELRAVVPAGRREEPKGAVMPAREALALIASDRFVAAEFDKASAALVLLRKYVLLAAGTEEITADSVAALK